jgi:hypothetical protein
MKKATTTEAENRLHYTIAFVLARDSGKEDYMYTYMFVNDMLNLNGNLYIRLA